jgi:hypothetical protein
MFVNSVNLKKSGFLNSMSIDFGGSGMALFGYLWLPDFPVWAAVQSDVVEADTPVWVFRGGRLIAISEEARRRGVARGWTTTRASALVPQGISLPHDAAACAFAWEQVLAALYEHTPRIESVREGLAVFEVPTRKAEQRKLARWVAAIGGRCGVATGRALAELAAYTTPAGTIRNVDAGREAFFLNALPVETLEEAGISPHTIQRLRWFGWQSVGQIKALNRQLCEQFEDGAKLWRYVGAYPPGERQTARKRNGVSADATVSLGKESVLPYVPPPSVEARLVFEQSATEPAEWQMALYELLRQACEQLNGQGASSLSVAAETARGRRVTSCLLREPVNTARPLMVPARTLVEALLQEDECAAIEVRLGNLSVRTGQGVLFETTSQTTSQREAVLHDVVRRLDTRFSGAVQRLHIHDVYSPLPEEGFHLVPWLDAVARLEATPKPAVSTQKSLRSRRAIHPEGAARSMRIVR